MYEKNNRHNNDSAFTGSAVLLRNAAYSGGRQLLELWAMNDPHTDLISDELRDRELETLRAEVAQARSTAEYWKAEHLAGNEVIAQLRAQLAAADNIAEKKAFLYLADECDEVVRRTEVTNHNPELTAVMRENSRRLRVKASICDAALADAIKPPGEQQ